MPGQPNGPNFVIIKGPGTWIEVTWQKKLYAWISKSIYAKY